MAVELTDRGHGVSTAVIVDAELLRSAGFVLAVRSQMPTEQLRQRFPAQTKVGPADRIRDLVNLQLPGITLRSLAVAPRQLPYHSGSHYFEFERQGKHQQQQLLCFDEDRPIEYDTFLIYLIKHKLD